MTILNSGTRNQYVATSGQTVFNYNFEIIAAADIAVYQGLTLLALSAGYTLTGVGAESGGTVTLVVGATTGDIITIYRDTSAERLTDYQNSGDFLSSEVNADFDRIWAVIQEMETSHDRFLQVSRITDALLPVILEGPVTGQLLRWKDPQTVESVPASSITPSGAITTDYNRHVTDYAALDAITALVTGEVVTVTASGVAGSFVVEDGAHTANVGTIRDFTSAVGNQYLRRLGTNHIKVSWFGAVGDGSDETVAITAAVTAWNALLTGGFGAQYPADNSATLYFQDGRWTASGLDIVPASTGGYIVGNGNNTQLDGISIKLTQNRCGATGFLMRGAGNHGIRIDGTTNSVRGGSIFDVNIRDRTHGLRVIGDNAHFEITNVYVEKCTDGFRGDGTVGIQLTNCHFLSNTNFGVRLLQGGEYKFDNCTSLGNENYGLDITGGTGQVVVESYFTQFTCTVNQTNTANRDTFAISSAADNGASGTTLTIGAHSLTEGMQGSAVTGTTSYNGTHDVFNVTDTTVDVAVAYVASETGTFTRPEWDMNIQSNSAVGNVNDMFFTGGNINFSRITSGYNISFSNTRLKEQLYLQGGCNRISRVGSARGRQSNSFRDISISGQNTGFTEILNSDPAAPSVGASNGSLLMRVPDNNSPVVANLPSAYNSVRVDEENGVAINMQYSGNSGLLADNTAMFFTPPKVAGFMVITNGAGQSARMAQVSYSTSVGTMADSGYVGSVMNLTTGVLSGTTGTDTKINISAVTDGKIYIENRSGGNQNMFWTLMR